MRPARFIGRHRSVEPLLTGVPPSWEIRRFKALLARSNVRNEDLSAPMMSLKSTGDVVLRSSLGNNQEPDDASLPRYLVTGVNELVVNPMWLVGGAIGVSAARGAVSPDYRVFTPCAAIAPRYLHYVVRSQPYIDQYLLYTRAQTTFDRRVQQPDLDNLPLPVPPIEEQRTIGNFLDRETARIDTLIEEQQRLIDLLRERRAVTIAEALSGLSGRTRLKYRSVVQTGVTLNGEGDTSWPEWPYLRVANVQVGRVNLAEVKTVRLPAEAASSSMLLPGDVLMTEGGDIDKLGRGALWSGEILDALHQNHIFAVRPDGRLIPEFLVYWLDGPEARTYFMTTAKQTTNLAATNKWILGNLPIVCPPLDEQRLIVALLDEQTSKIDTLIAETELFIELARERRSALITAAVTGQIDVRGEVA